MASDYVSQREAELRRLLAEETWWGDMARLWKKLGKVMSLKRDADYFMGEYNAIRSEYIRRGRKAKAA